MLLVTVLIVILLHLGLRHTQTGKAIRATFQQREAAALVGIDIDRLYTLTFAIGAGLAALAGVLLAPSSSCSHRWAGSPRLRLLSS